MHIHIRIVLAKTMVYLMSPPCLRCLCCLAHLAQFHGATWRSAVAPPGGLARQPTGTLSWVPGDEMGLGKTVQAIAFLLYLYSERHVPGPYLLICPLSVLTGWQQEFARFAPALRLLTYHGDQAHRDALRTQICSHVKAQPRDKWMDPSLPFHVLLVTYEIAIADAAFLQNFRFRYAIVDEAQRLKNHSSTLYTTLDQKYMIPRRLLLTGTPLQNNLHELWALLHFCMPKVWPEAQAFVHFFATGGTGGPAGTHGGPSGTAPGGSGGRGGHAGRSGHGGAEAQAAGAEDRQEATDAPGTPEVTSWPNVNGAPTQDTRPELAHHHGHRHHDDPGHHDHDDPGNPPGTGEAGPSSPAPDMDWKKLVLRPFILRRRKADLQAELSLPPLTKVTLYIKLSSQQKELYKGILRRNLPLLFGADERRNKRTEASSTEPGAAAAPAPPQRLQNTVMQLRKACSHPYLFEGQEPEPFEEGEHLVQVSGKLALLDALLTKLRHANEARRAGHAVLLYAQLTRTLDILQDYCSLRGIPYERLDGSVRAEERFAAIKAFSAGPPTAATTGSDDDRQRHEGDSAARAATGDGAEGGPGTGAGPEGRGAGQEAPFVFLLSTRAGGVGLNLVKADTVIFFELDWNPQVDLQAQERCHRMGQTRPVLVLQLVTQGTLEEVILQRGRRKLKLASDIMGQHIMGGNSGQSPREGDTQQQGQGQGQLGREKRRKAVGDVDGEGDEGVGVADDGMSRRDMEQMLCFGLHELASGAGEEHRAGTSALARKDSQSPRGRAPELEEGCDESGPGEGAQAGAAAASFLDEILAVRDGRKSGMFELVRGQLRPLGGPGGDAEWQARETVPEAAAAEEGVRIQAGEEAITAADKQVTADATVADATMTDATVTNVTDAIAATPAAVEAERPLDVYDFDGEGFRALGDARERRSQDRRVFEEWCRATPGIPGSDNPGEAYPEGRMLRSGKLAEASGVPPSKLPKEERVAVAREKKREELAAKRRMARWEELGYRSFRVASPEERKSEGERGEAEEGGTAGEEERAGAGGGRAGEGVELDEPVEPASLRFVVGDCTRPIAVKGPTLLPHARQGSHLVHGGGALNPPSVAAPEESGGPSKAPLVPEAGKSGGPRGESGGEASDAMEEGEPPSLGPEAGHVVARAFVCSCVDDSGSWGSGGMFRALSSRWRHLAPAYEKAGAARDLHLGDVHLLPADDAPSIAGSQAAASAPDESGAHPSIDKASPEVVCQVALLVVQECHKQGGNLCRGPVQMAALEKALATLADAAIRAGASVHLPRIGQGSSLSWYAVERLIRKCLCQRGVPVVVYYYRRQQ
eukprot:jgi/Mesvir1/25672/Mv01886-RA.1